MVMLSTIRTGLITWASTITGQTAIWSDQNSPQPHRPYVTVRMQNLGKVGIDQHLAPSDVTGDVTIIGNREFMVYLQALGETVDTGAAMSTLEQLDSSLESSTVRATLAEAGIVYVESEPVQNITGLEDSKYKDRASLDILFRTSSSNADPVSIIEKVTAIAGQFKDGVKTRNVNIDIP